MSRNRFYKQDSIDNNLRLRKQSGHTVTPEMMQAGEVKHKKPVRIDANTVIWVDQDKDEAYVIQKYKSIIGQI